MNTSEPNEDRFDSLGQCVYQFQSMLLDVAEEG